MSFMQEVPGNELEPGQTLGPYKLEELLGEGGMGLVFRAVRESDGEVVALKVMRFELIEDPVFGRRFEQEARAAQEVTEPHLVPVRSGLFAPAFMPRRGDQDRGYLVADDHRIKLRP